jgi:hypothetical protein
MRRSAAEVIVFSLFARALLIATMHKVNGYVYFRSSLRFCGRRAKKVGFAPGDRITGSGVWW